ncbi:EH signature domain-containing protein [Methylocaldum sp.]|uniref:EH signature domain-containing protein n=1 Tax=Methylocaldum sp. TaxID=1969727 RepID=UPI002D2D9DD7|nr:EH signature domain-containing protein [Methylocaldum sp.]HYE36946.1 EH signature domain-containing protein [Methylocaldum sp.]
MTLRESLATARPVIPPRLPDLPRVAIEEEKLARNFDKETKPVSTLDAEALTRRFRTALLNGTWQSISFGEWKLAVWIMFIGEKPLADEPEFLDRLFEQFRSCRKQTAYKGLILAYLNEFDPSKPAIRRVAQELEGAVRQFNWAWTDRHDRYRLFAPDEAPRQIANACLAPPAAPRSVLESLGMGGSRASGGMAAHAWLQALHRLSQLLLQQGPKLEHVDTILDWSVVDGRLLYPTPSHRAALASALLLPWAERNPTEEIKDNVSTFLLAHLKDPRLPFNAKEWVGVPDEAVAVLRKWLTGVALEQFCEVVDQVAQERMWRYRRAFWLAYYNADVINDAWVLFGPNAQSYARRAFGKTRSYGILERGYQVQADHSVLLMKIGKLTVADWSHNGKCHIWIDGNSFTPKLYLQRYTRDDVIRGADYLDPHGKQGQAHYGSEHGKWQSLVSSYIEKHTKIRISERDYMPYGWKR